MDDRTEGMVLQAFVELVDRVCLQERIGLYETTYWFDDGTHLQIVNFDELPADEEGEESTLDHTLHLVNPSFDVLVIGFHSTEWSFQLEEAKHADEFLRWHAERHGIVRVSGTD
jgi:hypothetical protein